MYRASIAAIRWLNRHRLCEISNNDGDYWPQTSVISGRFLPSPVLADSARRRAPAAAVLPASAKPCAGSKPNSAPEAISKPEPSAPLSVEPPRERVEDGDFNQPREGVAEIYVSIGRRDGARPSDIQTILEQSGLLAEQTDYIRVRQRNTFVGVKTEYLEKAVAALNGAAIAGKPAFAEPARQRD